MFISGEILFCNSIIPTDISPGSVLSIHCPFAAELPSARLTEAKFINKS
jgi:hypothetical protein